MGVNPMNGYLREPKKVRTRSELIKSCRGLREHNEKLKAQLKAVKDILYGSKHADIDKLEQIEAAIGESD